MNDGDIDYSGYTLVQLEEALSGINRLAYPKNYSNLRSAYHLLTGALPAEDQAESSVETDDAEEVWPGPEYDESGRYRPNQIQPGERAGHIVLSLMLLAYGSYGVWANDLYIPGRRSRGMHLQDVPAWIMYGAIVSACLVMISVVVDHYDRRDNERHYRALAKFGEILGWTLFGASLIWASVNGA